MAAPGTGQDARRLIDRVEGFLDPVRDALTCDRKQDHAGTRRDRYITEFCATLHIADITMFYAPASGGVRTYWKQSQLAETQPQMCCSMLVPGDKAGRDGIIHTLPAPHIALATVISTLRRAWVDAVALNPTSSKCRILRAGLGCGRAGNGRRAGDRLLPFRFAASGTPRRSLVRHHPHLLRAKPTSTFRSRAGTEQGDGRKPNFCASRTCVQPLGVDLQRFHQRARKRGCTAP